jgi:hypothetical protein
MSACKGWVGQLREEPVSEEEVLTRRIVGRHGEVWIDTDYAENFDARFVPAARLVDDANTVLSTYAHPSHVPMSRRPRRWRRCSRERFVSIRPTNAHER